MSNDDKKLESLYRSTEVTSRACDALRMSLETMRTSGFFDEAELEILAAIDEGVIELQERFTDRRLDMIAQVAPEALAEAVEVAESIGAEPGEVEAIQERVYQRTLQAVREDPHSAALANQVAKRDDDPIH